MLRHYLGNSSIFKVAKDPTLKTYRVRQKWNIRPTCHIADWIFINKVIPVARVFKICLHARSKMIPPLVNCTVTDTVVSVKAKRVASIRQRRSMSCGRPVTRLRLELFSDPKSVVLYVFYSFFAFLVPFTVSSVQWRRKVVESEEARTSDARRAEAGSMGS